jgi:hypothetical protein
MTQMVTYNLLQQLDLKANRQVIEKQIKNHFENGKEYAGLTKTPSHNLMLNK